MTNASASAHRIALVGDIGGTNTSLALVDITAAEAAHQQYRLLDRMVLPSQSLSDVMQGISQARARFAADLWQRIETCCFCAAGPIRDNRCTLTNVAWQIDGNRIAGELGVPTTLINDFSGICYGVPILFRQTPQRFTAIPHTDGRCPEADGAVIAVVGAGTGLGVGFLTTQEDGSVQAHPSEGGHSDFAPFDARTVALREFVASRHHDQPDAECFLSGPGIANILDFVTSRSESGPSAAVEQILAQPRTERPPLIARFAAEDPVCRDTMELFVRIYAKFASAVALHFFATGGLFLAGGIAAKNQEFFLAQDRFMRFFEQNYRDAIRPLLRSVPVHIVADYSVSLYGAAYAATRQYRKIRIKEEPSR